MRPLWSGSISFGLINIPIKLYSGSQERNLNLDLLEKGTLCRIGYARVCRTSGKEVKYEDLVRGYQYQEGDYVVLGDEDFKRANVKKTKSIEIEQFSDTDEIDSKYFTKPYYIEPDEKAVKAYVLLREALKRSGKIGIGRFVLRSKEYLAAIKPEGNLLILNQLRFEEEIRPTKGIEVPKDQKVQSKEVDMAVALINQLTEPFKPEEFHDTYTEELKKVIAAKAHGKKIAPKGKAPRTTQVDDLMSVLKESLASVKK
jgi:DNA end-binding protein Ku